MDGDRFILMNTDIVTDIDINPAIEFHKQSGAKMTLIMTDRYLDYPALADSLVGVGTDGKILKNRSSGEEVKSGIYTGIAVCEPSIIDLVPKGYSTLL
ncbi:MAG: hypothetical protein HY779_05530, partial [Rubrobacteridae bacterium]|nr:hypothetical protein [Rubrobacteridae bacterium]